MKVRRGVFGPVVVSRKQAMVKALAMVCRPPVLLAGVWLFDFR